MSRKNRNPLQFNCLLCKKDFFDFKSDKNRKYCSKKCYQKSCVGKLTWNKGKKQWQTTGEKNAAWKGGEIKKECLICGENYLTFPYRGKTAKFCSQKCYLQLKKSEETKNKMRIAKLGKPSPNKGKKMPNTSGEKHHNWKGGISSENHKIRTSLEFKKWRRNVFERDDYRCIGCGIKSGKEIKVILHADHIWPFSKFPRLRFDINNGRTLCKECHKQTETYNIGAKKFTIEGRPIIFLTQ